MKMKKEKNHKQPIFLYSHVNLLSKSKTITVEHYDLVARRKWFTILLNYWFYISNFITCLRIILYYSISYNQQQIKCAVLQLFVSEKYKTNNYWLGGKTYWLMISNINIYMSSILLKTLTISHRVYRRK